MNIHEKCHWRYAMKKFATQIDEKVLEELRLYAAESERSLSKIVNDALVEYLQKVRVRKVFLDSMDEVLDENEELLKRLAK